MILKNVVSMTNLVMLHLKVEQCGGGGGFDFSSMEIFSAIYLAVEIFLEISLAAVPEDRDSNGPMQVVQNVRNILSELHLTKRY